MFESARLEKGEVDLPSAQALKAPPNRRSVVQRRLKIGAASDPAEREADRVADSVIELLRSHDNRGSGSVGAANAGGNGSRIRRAEGAADSPCPWTARGEVSPTWRIRRSAEPLIRRSVYLANEDDSIYKDTDDDKLELAFVLKGQSKDYYFVDYAAVDRVQKIVVGKVVGQYLKATKPTKSPPTGSASKPKAATHKDHVRAAGERRKKASAASEQASELAANERQRDVRGDVRNALDDDESPVGKELKAAIGQIFLL